MHRYSNWRYALSLLILTTAIAVTASPRTLNAIRASGELRVLSEAPSAPPGIPRINDPANQEIAMLTNLAEWLGVSLKIIYLDHFDQLLPALERGDADMAAANISITSERQRRVDFSRPVFLIREHLITNIAARIDSLKQLEGKTVWVQQGTSHWKNIEALRKKYPGIKVHYSQDKPEELLYKVGTGSIGFAIVDQNVLNAYLAYRSDVKTVHAFNMQQQVAWAINRNATGLKLAVDRFLKQELPVFQQELYTGDLKTLQRRRIIRILTRNNALCYYMHRGVPMGFEYELANKFADAEKLIPVFIVPPSWKEMFSWLKDGRGDVIAANATITAYRSKLPGIQFCRPYLDTSELLITGGDPKHYQNRTDLNGKTLAVRLNSPYHETAKKLISAGVKLKMVLIPEHVETWEVLEMVAQKQYDLTIADDLIFNCKRETMPELKGVFRLPEKRQYAWMVRTSNPELRQAVDRYFTTIRSNQFFMQLYQRYFKNFQRFREFQSAIDKSGVFRLTPYDPQIRQAAEKFDFPWCLIAAQIFQESRFQADVVATDGGMGLMQLMPATAREMKCYKPFDPLENILAGTGYLALLRNRIPPPISPKDRLCLALASYNGGYGHVLDARKLAREMNLDPNRWLGNVEKTMALLATARYADRARYGFCRADIIIRYVNQIMTRFGHYNEEVNRRRQAGVKVE